GMGRTSEVSPLIVNGVMYLTTAFGRVAALEPETAKELWTFDVKDGSPATRGLEYWAGDGQSPATVFFGTSTGKLYALNAATGKLVPGFGDEGIVDMKPGALNGLANSSFGLSSPPIVYKNVVITGAHVQETPSIGAAGDTRAWDARTGKLLWTFHSVPRPGETGSETWKGDDWKNRSGTNVWGLFTIDAATDTLYMPFGESTTDYWGGDRPGANLFGTSLVAVNALTGKLKWYFQAVHHDVWDYDLCAPPVLFDVAREGKKIPAVGVMTKAGYLFILNRDTGKPVYPVEERPVPTRDALPGDEVWPTQPVPLKPPPLARIGFERGDLATVTPELNKYCTGLFDSIPGGLHAGGAFTHYSTTPSVIFPSSIGGGNWNPPSFDPRLGYLFVNTMDLGSLNVMSKNASGSGYRRMGYNGTNRFWEPESGMLCNQPPWGRLFAIDVNTGEIAWQSTLGITESLPPDKQKTGRPNLGGSLATAGGLVFIGATDDSRFRAFDSKTGKELWVVKIDAGAHSAPVTFLGKDGRQYVVITATGGGFLGDKSRADTMIAFALPAAGEAAAPSAAEASAGAVVRPRVRAIAATDGKTLLGELCASCHPLDEVTAARRTEAGWQQEVADMVARGSEGTLQQLASVVAYLTGAYGKVNVNTASPQRLAEFLGLSAREARAIVTYRTRRGDLNSFEQLLAVPGVNRAKLQAKRELIAFTP
ncbi:MAG: PQQ-binding-like beta-propeller repeat protein, partial [Acidobacteriota bacterium]|nr:PQQ-binding-like beta-propeller repeat protein [Acidobacteriota bacterium]